MNALNGLVLNNYDRPLEVKFAENTQAKEQRLERSKEYAHVVCSRLRFVDPAWVETCKVVSVDWLVVSWLLPVASQLASFPCILSDFCGPGMRRSVPSVATKMHHVQTMPKTHHRCQSLCFGLCNLVYGTMCTLLSTKSIARGWEPVRDATVTKPNPLTSRLWGSHAAAKNPHPTGTYLIRLPFMGPPMVTHAGRGHNICQESRNTSKLPLTLSRVWHIGVANPRRRVP